MMSFFHKGSVVLFVMAYMMLICSCGDDKSDTFGELTINFKAVYDGEPVVLLDEYTYPDGRLINFTRVSFYLSSFQLIGNNNAPQLDKIEYINMSDNLSTKTKSEEGVDYILDDLPSGDYSQLGFAFGLPASINATTPAEYPSESPLSRVSEYWGGWESYVFVKVEGNADLDNSGSLDNLEGISLHIGSDETYVPILIEKSIEITEDKAAQVNITIDLKDLFIQNGEIYDIVETPQIHSLSQTVKAVELSQNLVNSLIVN